MDDTPESTLARLWRDRVQLREQERNEAQAQARIAEREVAALKAENDRLTAENTQIGNQNDRLAAALARLHDQNDRLAMEVARLNEQNEQMAAEIALLPASHAPVHGQAQIGTEQQMEALRNELLSLIGGPARSGLH